MSLTIQFLLLCAFSWLILRRLRQLFVKSNVSNIPGPTPTSIFKGNFGQVMDVNGWDFHKHLTVKYGRVARIYGAFWSEHLYTFDPKALQHIILKDQHIFEETTAFLALHHVNFGPGLLATQGDHHRKQRKMLNPVFSTAHMRNMVPIFNDVTKKLGTAIRIKLANGPQEIDILHWMSRAALEMIGRSGLGYSFDPLVEGIKPHPYSEAIKNYIPSTAALAFPREYLLPIFSKIGSPRFRRAAIDFIPWKRLHKLRDIVNVMSQTSIEIFEQKKKALEGEDDFAGQSEQGKDIMSILMRANLQASEADRLSDEEVLGQVSTFTFAGTDTTSNALCRTLHLLSSHPEVQNRLRAEIKQAINKYGTCEDIPYDELVALPFLDAVCRETLRLYPPVHTAMRVARQDTSVPLSTPIKGIDGREIHSLLIPKNTRVFLSLMNANRDPALWGPDSYEWKPERWLSPLPQPLIDARLPGIYSNLMTFLGGGRACIGFKFSQLEMKAVLAGLLSQFSFSPVTSKQIQWKMTGIVTPSVEGSAVPQLPLKVALVDG